ncbi:MAG: PAS domain S-box protein, partial [Planctomycetes bacterium]|nr:PAS domain S-box protein [Planctomycetota bacterium]
TKILFWFLVISIPPALGIVIAGYWRSRELVEEQTTELLASTVDMVTKEIRNFLTAKKARLVDFASDGLIRDSLRIINLREPGKEAVVEKLNQHLSVNKLPLDPDFVEILLIDLQGKVVASSNETMVGMDASNKDYFVEGWRHGIYVSDLHLSAATNEPVMTLSRFVTNTITEDPVGMMTITIRGSILSNITRNWDNTKEDRSIPRFRGMGRTGEVFIVNEDYRMITESRFVEDAVLKQVVYTEFVKGVFSTDKESSGIYLDYRGVEVLGTARIIDEMMWVVVAKKDFAEVVEPISGLRNIGIGLCIAGVVVVTFVAFFITRSLTKPIHKLVVATERVSEGDLDYRVLITSKDEVGHLSDSFNEMILNLKKSRGEHRALFDDGIDAMFVLGDGERIADVNKSACVLLGQERNALIETNVSDLICKDETIGVRRALMGAVGMAWTLPAGEKHPTLDVSLVSKEGGCILCELDIKRTDYGVLAVLRDVTERRRLEQAIADEKQRLDDIVSEMGVGLSLIDRDMKVVWMNKLQSKWFGEIGELRGMQCYNAYWNNNEICQECPSRRTFTSGNLEKSVKSYITPDGKQKWYNITSSPLKSSTGHVTYVLELIEDVTNEKEAEEKFKKMHESVVQVNTRLELYINKLKSTQRQLIQAEKMASVGQMASSVAHEINNPLSYVDNNLYILTRYSERIGKFVKKCEEGKPIVEKGDVTQIMTFFKEVQDLKKEIKLDVILKDFDEVIEESSSGIEQIKRITSNLSIFSHIGEELPKSTNLNKVIEGILTVVWGELKYKAEIIKEYGDIPDMKCYPQQLGQVFMNLLMNAAHSIEGSGKITIKTYKADNNIYVEVKDTGKGMPEEVKSKIFEPFFTTKEPGKGTGLGLTVAYNIVQKHFGRIEVSSKVGEGTTFTVVLPIRE